MNKGISIIRTYKYKCEKRASVENTQDNARFQFKELFCALLISTNIILTTVNRLLNLELEPSATSHYLTLVK